MHGRLSFVEAFSMTPFFVRRKKIIWTQLVMIIKFIYLQNYIRSTKGTLPVLAPKKCLLSRSSFRNFGKN